MADIIKLTDMDALYTYMRIQKPYIQNQICKKILEAIDQNSDMADIMTFEFTSTDTVVTVKVPKDEYIQDLKKNFDGLVKYENYELAARAKKLIDENLNDGDARAI